MSLLSLGIEQPLLQRLGDRLCDSAKFCFLVAITHDPIDVAVTRISFPEGALLGLQNWADQLSRAAILNNLIGGLTIRI